MEQKGTNVPGMTLSLLSAYTLTGAPGVLLASITSSMRLPELDLTMSGAWRGTLMMTPLPVPNQSLLQDTCSAVMRTNENPSLPVPENIFQQLYQRTTIIKSSLFHLKARVRKETFCVYNRDISISGPL